MLQAVLFDLVGTLLDFGDGRLLKVGMRISSIWAIYRSLKAQGVPVPPLLTFIPIAARQSREIDRAAGMNGHEKNLRVVIPRVLENIKCPANGLT